MIVRLVLGWLTTGESLMLYVFGRSVPFTSKTGRSQDAVKAAIVVLCCPTVLARRERTVRGMGTKESEHETSSRDNCGTPDTAQCDRAKMERYDDNRILAHYQNRTDDLIITSDTLYH